MAFSLVAIILIALVSVGKVVMPLGELTAVPPTEPVVAALHARADYSSALVCEQMAWVNL